MNKLTDWTFDVEDEIRVRLSWHGPFLLLQGKLQAHPLEPCDIPPEGPGLYAISSQLPERAAHQLSYIGESDAVHSRLATHYSEWLNGQWRLEIYVAPLAAPAEIRRDAEALLIRAHVPSNNTKHIARSARITHPLRIRNEGRHPSLAPEVSLQHPWYRD